MERLLDGAAVPESLRGGVVALGNFDGFHLGHQAVAGRAVARARAEGRPALVATFDPHPARLFRPELPPFALTSRDQKLDLFEAFGVDGTIVMHFDRAFAALGAETFVAEWLGRQIGAAAVVSGGDFTFGRGRSGDADGLARLGTAHGIAAEVVAPVADNGEIVSSSRIRALLQEGRPEAAALLMTRSFTISGIVVHGAKLGRTLGFPTANIDLDAYLRPRYGVYAIRARLEDGSIVNGVANIGVRPMIEPPLELLEAHLFDWSGDLYGQRVEVELHHFIRPEWKLDGLPALITQITADCAEARAWLDGSLHVRRPR
ncbi:MAG: bifunctional riboflavin kinase/FAD synthetase [Janthinobacterium lividum]